MSMVRYARSTWEFASAESRAVEPRLLARLAAELSFTCRTSRGAAVRTLHKCAFLAEVWYPPEGRVEPRLAEAIASRRVVPVTFSFLEDVHFKDSVTFADLRAGEVVFVSFVPKGDARGYREQNTLLPTNLHARQVAFRLLPGGTVDGDVVCAASRTPGGASAPEAVPRPRGPIRAARGSRAHARYCPG